MATNPNNAVGTNGAYPGRTSVNAFNDSLGVYAGRGILSGFHISANSGMSVSVGGNGLVRDVAIAEDNLGNRTTINNISGAPITVSIPAAPASGSRYDTLVAYVTNPPKGSNKVLDNPMACGLIVVSGSAGDSPIPAGDAEIRNAITLDSGASGEVAYYVTLGEVLVASGTTSITSEMVTQETQAILSGGKIIDGTLDGSAIKDGTIHADKVEDLTLPWSKMDHETLWEGNYPSSSTDTLTLNKSIAGFQWLIFEIGLSAWPIGAQGKTFIHENSYAMDADVFLDLAYAGRNADGSLFWQHRVGIIFVHGDTFHWDTSGRQQTVYFAPPAAPGLRAVRDGETISLFSIIGIV